MLSVLTLTLLSQSWTCNGQPPLPSGEAVEYEVGFAANGRSQDLVEEAKKEGILQLNRRFCPQQSEDCLRSLRQEIIPGTSGRSEAGACVVVYIPTSRLSKWKATRAVTEFEEQLTPRVKSLLEKAGHRSTAPLTVSVGLLEDMPGAPVARVSWMKDQLEKALTAAGARLGPSPNTLAGRIYGRSKEERLDLAIDLATADGRFSESLTFSPLAAGADTPTALSLSQTGLKGRVALMPLELGSSQWTADQVESFNLLIKQESGALLNEISYAVEPLANATAARCDDRCASETAQRLAATHFITGSVKVDDGTTTVFLFLREVGSLAQKGELRIEGTTTKDLRRDFAAKSSAFFSRMISDVKRANEVPVSRTLSWVAVGVGAAALAVGGVFFGLAQSTIAGNTKGVEGMLVTNSITEKRAMEAVTLSLVSSILLVSGAVIAGTGVVGVIVTPTTNGAALSVGGTF